MVCLTQLSCMGAGAQPQHTGAVQARYKEILDMPTSLFSARRVGIYFTTYGLVVLGFLLQLADLLRR